MKTEKRSGNLFLRHVRVDLSVVRPSFVVVPKVGYVVGLPNCLPTGITD